MKFSTKLTCLILFLVLTASAIVTYIVFTSNLEILSSQIEEEIEDHAFFTMRNIDWLLYERYLDIQTIASDPIIRSARMSSPAKVTTRLQEFKKHLRIVKSISFFDLNRIRIADTNNKNIGKQEAPNKWTEKAIKQNQVSAATHIEIDKDSGEILIYFAAPVKDENNKPIGVVVLRIPISKIEKITTSTFGDHEITGDWKIEIVDKEGILIFSSHNKKGVFKEKIDHWHHLKEAIKKNHLGVINHIHEENKLALHIFMHEQGYLDFKGNNWTLQIHVPHHIAFLSVISLRNKLIIILAIFSLLLTIIVFLISNTFLKPLISFNKAAISIGKGNFDVKIPIISDDEIGQLARAFNKMTNDLKTTTVSRDYMDNIFQFMNDMLFVVSMDGNIQKHNASASSLLGYEEKIVNRNISTFLSWEGQDSGINFNSFAERFSGKSIETVYRTRKGTNIPVIFSCSIIYENSVASGVVCVAKDISGLKKAEGEVIVKQQQLIQADKLSSIGVMVSGVAHEINNPNNFIMFNTPIINQIWDDAITALDKYYKEEPGLQLGGLPFEEVKTVIPDLLSAISEGSLRIKSIVDKLREYTGQTISETFISCYTNNILEKAINLLESTIKKYTEKFSVKYKEGIPSVYGNPSKIEQVIVNIILNACQSLTGTKTSISITTVYNKETKYAEIIFKDEGMGIPEEELKKIMDPFYTTKRDSGGTGLGLSLSYSIVQEHKGELEVTSKVNKGTTVTLRLPCKD